MQDKLIKLLIDTPDCIKFSARPDIEAQSNFKSPIFINMKMILGSYQTRSFIGNMLLKRLASKPDLICGMESGGNYLATYLADQLRTGLGYFRRTPKEYGAERDYIGSDINAKTSVLFVDDVIATGKSLERVKTYFDKRNCKFCASYVFTYGHDRIVAAKTGAKIQTLINLETLLDYSLGNGYIDKEGSEVIKKHVLSFKP